MSANKAGVRRYDALIVCGGDTDLPLLSRILSENPDAERIAADRGLEAFSALGEMPDILMGDYDSADQSQVRAWQTVGRKMRTFPAEKDYSDAEAALRYAANGKTPRRIALLGATGGRLDHFLANVQILRIALDLGVEADILDPCNRIRLIDRKTVLKRSEVFGTYVSVLPFTDLAEGVTMEGFRYPLDGADLVKGSTLTVSNEITSDEAVIDFRSGILILLETRDRQR